MIIFSDIDWTLAHCGHRVVTFDHREYVPGHFFDYKEINWRFFNSKPNIFDYALETYLELIKYHTIVYVTSRERKTGNATLEWLWMNGFPHGKTFCCTKNNSDKINNKEYVFVKYRKQINEMGAVMYDDDFSGHLQDVVDKYNIQLIKPDYVYGKKDFWKKEYKRLQKSNWQFTNSK